MKRKLLFSTLFFSALFFANSPVHALALADLRLNSSLNQPLDATIELLSASNRDLDNLKTAIVRSPASGNVQWPRIEVKLVRIDGSRSYLQLTSKEAVQEPVLEFLLELDWPEGSIKREYSLLIDPQ